MVHHPKWVRLAVAGLGAAVCLGGLTRGSVANPNFDTNAFQTNALSEHNIYRGAHHSPALTRGEVQVDTAQAYAETILSTGVFIHSSSDQRNGAGENLYYTFSQFPLDPEDLAFRAVGAWYEEVVDYDYGDPGFGVDTGHFTQVVWKSTTQLGCGVAQGPKTIAGRTGTANYVVCHYAPDGNNGDFASNVLQP